MKVLPVYNRNNSSSVNFGRKPNPVQMKYYSESISEGLRVLNKEVGMIIHNSSLPSIVKENLGIGSLLTKTAAKFFLPFLKQQGVSTIQQDPIYIRRSSDPSPYDPISTSKNIYMIPLEKLASGEYGKILEQRLALGIVASNSSLETPQDRVVYSSVESSFNIALQNAYGRFKSLIKGVRVDINTTPADMAVVAKLNNEFEVFKANKRESLEANALYEILMKQYQDEDWKNWEIKDRDLFLNKDIAYLNALKTRYAEDIDFYLFKQWLVEREIAETNKINQNLGIKVIADTPIAFTPAEEWQHQELFLKDLVLGCPPDYFSKEGQRWGFAVLNPQKIFNKDGSLGPAGEFLKQRYEEIFKASPGGVRIDHLIGLIDPFVYLETEPHMNEKNSGRLYSSPHLDLLKEYGKYTDAEFTAIFDKIIFPTAERFGITKDKIICEDLGDQTPPVKRAIEKLGLTGLSVTQFGYSGYDAPERNVIMLGGHDNQSYIEYTDDMFARASGLGEGRDRFIFRTHILGSDTVPYNKDVNLYREEIRGDKKKFMLASFVELFTSKARKVQIFFTDFFGIGKTYNVPGTKKDCWTLRLTPDYEDLYYKNLAKGLGVNLPETLATAIRQKGEDFSKENQKLLRKLDFFTMLLKK